MIRLQSVNKNYGSGSGMTCALKDVTVDIDEGSFTVILGASGSGKSTLLNVVSGLERVDSGKILFGDADIASMGDKELTLFRRRSVGLISAILSYSEYECRSQCQDGRRPCPQHSI